jgi:hypothetical protein
MFPVKLTILRLISGVENSNTTSAYNQKNWRIIVKDVELQEDV